jgi:hypothetical protein
MPEDEDFGALWHRHPRAIYRKVSRAKVEAGSISTRTRLEGAENVIFQN